MMRDTFTGAAWCPKCSRVVAGVNSACPKCGTELDEQGTGDDDPYPEESARRLWPSVGEQLVRRELRKEKRAGVEHYVSGQYFAEIQEGGALLSYVDVMGHAVLVACAKENDVWVPIVLRSAGQRYDSGAKEAPPDFRLSRKMLDALAEAEARAEQESR